MDGAGSSYCGSGGSGGSAKIIADNLTLEARHQAGHMEAALAEAQEYMLIIIRLAA